MKTKKVVPSFFLWSRNKQRLALIGAAIIRLNPVPTISPFDDKFWRKFCLVTLHFILKQSTFLTFLHLHLDRRGHFNNSSTLTSQLVVFCFILHSEVSPLLWMRYVNDKFVHRKLRFKKRVNFFQIRKWKVVKLLDKKIWRIVAAHWDVNHRRASCHFFMFDFHFRWVYLYFIMISSIFQPNTWLFC